MFRFLIMFFVISLLIFPIAAFSQQQFIEHSVVIGYNGPWCVRVTDLDNDLDNDVLAVAYAGNTIDWWENDGNQILARHIIASGIASLLCCEAGDFDNDGDKESRLPPVWPTVFSGWKMTAAQVLRVIRYRSDWAPVSFIRST